MLDNVNPLAWEWQNHLSVISTNTWTSLNIEQLNNNVEHKLFIDLDSEWYLSKNRIQIPPKKATFNQENDVDQYQSETINTKMYIKTEPPIKFVTTDYRYSFFVSQKKRSAVLESIVILNLESVGRMNLDPLV